MSGLERLTALELRAGYRSRAFSPLEVIDALARRIEALNPARIVPLGPDLGWGPAEPQAATGQHSNQSPLVDRARVPAASAQKRLNP